LTPASSGRPAAPLCAQPIGSIVALDGAGRHDLPNPAMSAQRSQRTAAE
jgi:hypothetical protein